MLKAQRVPVLLWALFSAVAVAQKGYSICDPTKGSIFDFQAETLDGRVASLAEHAGNTLMIINVATY